MKAPEDLKVRFQEALREAKALLDAGPLHFNVKAVTRAAELPELSAQVVVAAQLYSGLTGSRQFDDMSPEIQEAMMAHDDAVNRLAAAALDLLAYEEIEDYLLSHRAEPEVQALIRNSRASARGRRDAKRQRADGERSARSRRRSKAALTAPRRSG